jgi:hypothetical protein
MHHFYHPTNFLISLLVLLIVGCQPAITKPIEKTKASLPTSTITITNTPQPTKTIKVVNPTPIKNIPQPTETTVAISRPISDDGPWFVFYSKEEKAFIAANDDGTGRKVIFSNKSGWGEVAGSITNLVAIVTDLPELEAEYPKNLALVILSLPDGEMQKTIPLISYPEIPEEFLEGLGAAVSYESIAWSPDGQYLAFIGAIDGASADLYIYEIASNNYFRLTTGKNRAAEPQWSPDGKWIVHHELDNVPGMCDFIALWAASVESHESEEIYKGGCSPTILEWLSPTSFVSIVYMNGAINNLRIVTLDTKTFTKLMPDYVNIYDGLSFAINTQGKQVVYSALGDTDHPEFEGTYAVSLTDAIYHRIFTTELSTVWMPGINKYVASPASRECGVLTFNSEGEFACLNDKENAFSIEQATSKHLEDYQMSVSPTGQWLLLSFGDGLYLYDNNLEKLEIVSKTSEKLNFDTLTEAIWRTDSKAFVFSSEGMAYYVELETLIAQPITQVEDWDNMQLNWNSDLSGFYINQNSGLGYYDVTKNSYINIGETSCWDSISWVGKP